MMVYKKKKKNDSSTQYKSAKTGTKIMNKI